LGNAGRNHACKAAWPRAGNGSGFLSVVASAQQPKAPKVGVILQGGPWYAVVEGLRDGLNELGLVEGKNFVLEIRDTEGDLKAVERAAKELEQTKVNLIYTAATSVSLSAQKATESGRHKSRYSKACKFYPGAR